MRATRDVGRKSQESRYGRVDPCPNPNQQAKPSLTDFLPNHAGQKSNLIVSVLSYTPHVHCSAPRAAPPTIKACAELQNRMFASADALVFGPMEEPGVEAGLPQSWLLPTSAADLGSCAMVVNTRGPLDTASWFDVWAGAGAVAAMCVRRGLVGISTGQGEFCRSCGAVWFDVRESRLMESFVGVLGNIFVIVRSIL